MGDVRDWGAFIRGRWDWTRFGYERNLPRRSGFGDIDATLELNGYRLTIESKYWDGEGDTPTPPHNGQMRSLRQMALSGRVWILAGCAACNNPLHLTVVATEPEHDRFIDWRHIPLPERRAALKEAIDTWARWAEHQIGETA